MEELKLSKSERAQDLRLRRIYKKTLKQKLEEIAAQGNRCAICPRPYPQYTLYQDHDHECCKRPRGKKGNTATFCGKCSRGWLCFLCNRWAIGALEYMARLNPPIPAEKAFAYLKAWKIKIKERGGYAVKN